MNFKSKIVHSLKMEFLILKQIHLPNQSLHNFSKQLRVHKYLTMKEAKQNKEMSYISVIASVKSKKLQWWKEINFKQLKEFTVPQKINNLEFKSKIIVMKTNNFINQTPVVPLILAKNLPMSILKKNKKNQSKILTKHSSSILRIVIVALTKKKN